MKSLQENVFSEILTSKDVKKLLCISQSTLQRMRNKGELTGYKLSGRIYYKKSEIMSSLESGKLISTCGQGNSKVSGSKVGKSKLASTKLSN